MKNKTYILILAILGMVFTACTLLTFKTDTTNLPPTNATSQAGTESTYEIAEVLEASCTTHDDCELPFDYAIRSNCPYQSLCLQNKCTVVCPFFNDSIYLDPTKETVELETNSPQIQ